MVAAGAEPKVTSPFTMVSVDFSKIRSSASEDILMLVRLPVLQPDKVSKISLSVIATFILGLVISIIFSINLKPLLGCFSPQGLSSASVLPTPRAKTSPFIASSGRAVTFYPLQVLERMEGYLEAPYAQSMNFPTFSSYLSSQRGPAVIAESLPQQRTIFAISVQMPKSSTLSVPSWYFWPQLKEKEGFPSCTQIVRSIGYVRNKQLKLFTAAVLLHQLSPKGKSFSISILPGLVYREPFAMPEGLARGRKIVLAAFRVPKASRRMLGLTESSPLSPETRSTVRLACSCLEISVFQAMKQQISQGLCSHISASDENCLRVWIESIGTFCLQSPSFYRQRLAACVSQRRRTVIINFIL